MLKVNTYFSEKGGANATYTRIDIQGSSFGNKCFNIQLQVSGNNPKGSLHLYNLDGVSFRNEQTGELSIQVNESFTGQTAYVTDGKVNQITAQSILYSKEYARLTMNVYKDGETVFSQSKQLTAIPGTDTTIDLVYSTVK